MLLHGIRKPPDHSQKIRSCLYNGSEAEHFSQMIVAKSLLLQALWESSFEC
jgi:hypothetical protein